jgi:leucyl-tRNA synthetase
VTHRTIQAVTEALEGFAFNVAVARLHELANAMTEAERAWTSVAEPGLAWARLEAAWTAARLAAPLMPHVAEEIHLLLAGPGAGLVADMAWPVADALLARTATVTIGVQVGGKLRGTIETVPDAPETAVLAMAEDEPNVARALAGRRIVKRVYVPNRIVNFVVGG